MSDVSETAAPQARVAGPPPGGAARGAGLVGQIGGILLRQREASVLVVGVIMFVYFAVTTHAFVSHGSFLNVAQYMAPYVIIGIGLVLVMICGEIDLSVGYVWLSAPFAMRFLVDSGVPLFAAIVLVVLGLSLVGFVNGFVTTFLGVPSLITTLATGYIVFGVMLTTTAAQQQLLPPSWLGVGKWFGYSPWSEFIWAVALVVLFQILLTQTRWGLYTISVGGNLLGAREAGIRVNWIKIGNFMMTSALGAIAGILESFHDNVIDPSAGQLPVVLVALAGAVIGGTAMTGGSGTMIGLFLGMAVLGILQDGFNLRGISSNTYQIILGAAILIAMVANTYLARLRGAGRLQRRSL